MTNKKYKILITGGAGFIGSNLIDHFLQLGHEVVCLDNLSTGFEHNIEHNYKNKNFKFIKGDIRDLEFCNQAVKGCDYVSHQAALGSVPRSIKDPITTNEVNISGFLNMLIASRDEGIKRFVYAASSSTYGDSKKLPKVEHEIGKPLSPYAITKYVNELYADIFAKTYGMQCIGLRYFNVFGKRQDPNGAYAAVIPLWVNQLLNHESPVINGDGSYSRDFTYIENVIQANDKALFVTDDNIIHGQKEYYGCDKSNRLNNQFTFSEIFNIAFGNNITLIELFDFLKIILTKFDIDINKIAPDHGPNRDGDIPHSLANINKAAKIIDYHPNYNAKQGFEIVAQWYFEKFG
jgi:UDP-N-acetylglucosamine/UDP-N-acetylgalactosamine 4-epimerase